MRAPSILLGLALAVTAPAAAQQPVRIGLVIPGEGPLAEVGAAVRRGAEVAVRQANAAGGYDGRPIELRVVTEEGLWGQGLGKVVSLSFDDPVLAVIGGLDGRSGHLIQQVITKARIPFVTPWATDFTLSRAMVPWFFQAVPDDRQQAAAIIGDAMGGARAGATRGVGTDATRGAASEVVVLADTSYDSRYFATAIRRAAASADAPVRFLRPERVLGPEPGVGEVLQPGRGETAHGSSGPASRATVVLAVDPATASRVLDRLRRLPTPPRVYAPTRLATPPVAAANYPGPLLVPLPAGTRLDPDDLSLPAALAGDAVRALIAAIRVAGPDPWRIRDALADGSLTGATGGLTFEPSGRRGGELRLEPLALRSPEQ